MSRRFKKQEVMRAINGSRGIILNVANKLGCNWVTAKKYIDKWNDTIEALEHENEAALDFTESRMFDRINDGSDQMIKFHLDRKGRKRGYGEHQKIETEMNLTLEDIEKYLDYEDE